MGGAGGGLVDRPICRPIGRSMGRSICRSIGRSIGRSNARSIGRSIGRTIGGRSIERSIIRSIRSIGRWSIMRSIGKRSIGGRSIMRSIGLSIGRSMSDRRSSPHPRPWSKGGAPRSGPRPRGDTALQSRCCSRWGSRDSKRRGSTRGPCRTQRNEPSYIIGDHLESKSRQHYRLVKTRYRRSVAAHCLRQKRPPRQKW